MLQRLRNLNSYYCRNGGCNIWQENGKTTKVEFCIKASIKERMEYIVIRGWMHEKKNKNYKKMLDGIDTTSFERTEKEI